MVKVTFTSALKQFFPDLSPQELEGASIKEIITAIESIYPGMQDYLLEEDGSLRKHVNIFVRDEMMIDRHSLSDTLTDGDEVLIFQALSGG
ncbi:MAG: molybdenum cofactor biosynthesis protein MoaD [Flammeovirgaceae bacterium TMED32]|nr:MAG: molybdenum cofactor biosynthesis protein MoaD [Flammeovirgaceae bacterium TMED32]